MSKISIGVGATLVGFLQTENVGMERIICYFVTNTNIRHSILCGIESIERYPGHTLEVIMENVANDKRMILYANSQMPY